MPETQNNTFIPPQLKAAANGSLGLKLIIVCALVMLMAIPAMFISYISYERSSRADDVINEVSQRYGGEQYISGPMLVAPYVQMDAVGRVAERGNYVVFAEKGTATFSDIETTIRKRSLFKVPTYQGVGILQGQFGQLAAIAPDNALQIDWERAKIIVALSDVRGLKQDVALILPSGETRSFEPAIFDTAYNQVSGSVDTPERVTVVSKNYQSFGWMPSALPQTYLSVNAAELIKMNGSFDVKVSLAIGGAKRLGVTPFAQSTTVELFTDWPDPGFEGGFPPDNREINAEGFTADWTVPYLRRGIRAHGKAHRLASLTGPDKIMTVQFVSTDNPYQTVNRALKYAVMFIGLVFIAYFLFEVIVGVRVHPAQYILIGLAQSIFYLLLLAFAERIGFTGAFLISAGATVAATAGYAGAVFGHKKYILRAGAVFALVYGLLYILMRMQDFALMVGALASFAAISGMMYLTRNLDWYGIKEDT